MGWAAKLWSLVLVAFVVTGSIGAYAYVDGSWRYRGFPPPSLPARIAVPGEPGRSVPVSPGSLQALGVTSSALNGHTARVLVLLPPGYASHPEQRYPVLYLLHGTPGAPSGFIDVGQVAVRQDELQALGRIRPMIIVMPSGADSSFGDTEWANGVAPGAGWETYLARDVVGAIDAHFRTIPRGWARAIGGLSEGGYGAINIALHHPGEFDTVESWSGYEIAQNLPAIFGGDPQVIAENSPLVELPGVADALLRDGVRFWFYSSPRDRMRFQNRSFARLLGAYGIPHRYFVVVGNHSWTTWRPRVPAALIVASRGLERRRAR